MSTAVSNAAAGVATPPPSGPSGPSGPTPALSSRIGAATRPVSFGGVLRSEWIKFVSVRSNVITLLGSAGLLVLIGLIFSGLTGGILRGGGDASSEFAKDPAGATLQGAMLAQLVIGVLGVLVVTGEYSSRLIRSTMTAVPTRLPVLWAKTLVVAAVALPVLLLSAVGVFFAGQALIGSGGVATAALGDAGVLRGVTGTAFYLTGIALIGVALGFLLRSTAGAISTLFGAVFLLPGLGELLLPTSWKESILPYLPSNAGSAFTSVTPDPALLGAATGFAVFLIWIAVPLGLAAAALRRRSV